MTLSNEGVRLIKNFEGCSLKAYPDPATQGAPWTIGYGWTQPVDGTPVFSGMVISAQKAEQLLHEGLKHFQQSVNEWVKVPLAQPQFDACVSLAYNIGLTAFKSSTLLKKLNAGDSKGAAKEFLRWNKANGKVMQGLVMRRAAEKQLFLS